MARPVKADELLVHQAVHGYRHGHELLRASIDFDDEVANLLSRNSDSAPNVRASSGPYLTGYPVPDGRYVMARTWPDIDAARPNTVLTHSLILPIGGGPQLSANMVLDSLANKPSSSGALSPIKLTEMGGRPLTLSRDEAEVAAQFYGSPERPLAYGESIGRDRIALGIWSQLWRSARARLRFCTAPDAGRFSTNDRSIRFESGEPTVITSGDLPASTALIVDDLVQPGSFRDFIHIVGAGEVSIGLVEPLAQAYGLLGVHTATVEDFVTWLDKHRGSDPKRLRRLKRRFLGFKDGEPRWAADPIDLLQSLAAGALGSAVYASDASLDQWVRLGWEVSPEQTADLLNRAEQTSSESPGQQPTATRGLAEAFSSQASRIIMADTLSLAVGFDRETAFAAIWERNEPGLWRAWSELEEPSRVGHPAPDEPYRWEVPVGTLRVDTEAIGRLLRHHPEALDALISLANHAPAASDGHINLTGDAKRYIRNRLEGPDPELVGLARLSDHGALPKRLTVEHWVPIVANSADDVVVATAYLIARQAPASHWEVATLAVAALYRALADRSASEAWLRLSPHIRGDRDSWDRCGRLTGDFAEVVRHYNDDTKVKTVSLLERTNGSASRSLEQALQSSKSKQFKLLDPTTWI